MIKKNLHIKYKDPNQLHEIMSLLANAEIYDLVKVDYFSEKMEATKAELANKARALLQEKMKNYKLFLGDKIDNSEKYLVG